MSKKISSSDTGSPVMQGSITGLESASIPSHGSPLAIGAGLSIGETFFKSTSDIHLTDSDSSGIAHELTHVVQQKQGRM